MPLSRQGLFYRVSKQAVELLLETYAKERLMRIVCIGCVRFSASVLQKLFELRAEVVGVVTRTASSVNADFTDLGSLARSRGVPILADVNINAPESLTWMAERRPDIVLCCGWSSLLGPAALAVAPQGVIGYHPAELPRNRGRHPLIWALALGLTRTASTFFFMDEGADSGDILSQEAIPIRLDDDAGSLYARMSTTALAQIEDFLPRLQAGTLVRRPQDHFLANTWRKRGKADGRIDFRMDSRTVYNLVRALTRPYVGAHLERGGIESKVWKVREDEAPEHLEPGKVLATRGREALVKCGRGGVWLMEHELLQPLTPGEYL